jgi:hypothetical protein
MQLETFVASRWTSGNFLFPTRIIVSDQSVMRHKRSWFSVDEESIHVRNVASVDITTGLFWSNLRIESSGGTDPITSHGHTKSDARRIKELIEMLQAGLGSGTSTTPDGDTRVCPYCAETIKKAARACRYCKRELDTA